MSRIITADQVRLGAEVVRVIAPPDFPGEYMFEGEIVRIRHITPGFITIDNERGAMTLPEAIQLEVQG